jgi:ArsR family transcriptional regulator
VAVYASRSGPAQTEGSCCLPRRIKQADRKRARRLSTVAKALADPMRVEIVELLRQAEGEVCQCELQPLFDVTQPTLSHHLRKLAEAELVAVERRGKWAYYSIQEESLKVLRSWLS